ncbi:MAG TPA: hypothetical protein DHW34_02160 [Actinobacteria bacterium]|nr:hypothetical protein [Actinomycetota bacterium]
MLMMIATAATTVFTGCQFFLTRQTIQIDQRAWLSYTFSGETKLPVADNHLDIRLPLNNSGKTPAFKVVSSALVKVVAGPAWQPTEDDWRRFQAINNIGVVLPSEAGRWLRIDSDVPPNDAARFRNGDRLFVYVRVNYCDAFRRYHQVNRCGSYSIKDGNAATYCGTESDEDTGQSPPVQNCRP